MKRRTKKILAKRPGHREYWNYPPGSPDRLAAVAMWRRMATVWRKCKEQAIESAAGI